MATTKDLAEAYAFSRRRLVTALVSGAPGGREVEPARPGRAMLGGLALAVLLVAGAALAGVYSPRVDQGWAEQPGLIISRESGAAYVVTEIEGGDEPVLRPVVNITSAKLILGPDVEPTIVSDEHIQEEQRGDDIGILGAPVDVPDADRLVNTGWTVCTDAAGGHGIRLAVSREPEVAQAPGGALLVKVQPDRGPEVFVIATGGSEGAEAPRAYRYRVPRSKDRDNLLGAIGLPRAGSASVVPEEWLALFPRGGDLTRAAFHLEGEGGPASYATGLDGLEDARIGDVVAVPTRRLLLTQHGPVDLDPFPAGVYLAGDPVDITLDEPPALVHQEEPYLDAHWPEDLVTPVPGQQCARLTAAAGRRPGVEIVTTPTGDASATEVELGDRSVRVDAGAGAFVRSGGWDRASGGEPYLVDARGQRYPLVGASTADRLGYADQPVVTVPGSWIELFYRGVSLSESAALCPPGRRGDTPCA